MGYRPRKCKICGEKFIPTGKNNTVCPKPECKAENRKVIHERHRKKEKERKAMEGKVKKPDTLAEADAKAREEGLSYGQRELKLWM